MIDAQQFNTLLNGENADKGLAKTYLFYGNEPFLSEENAQALVAFAKTKNFTQREIYYLDNRAKCQPIIDAMKSPGLFDPKKIIELRFETAKPTKKLGEQVAKIAQHQSDNLLLIQGGHWEYKIQKEKWFTHIMQIAKSVIAKPIYANQLPNWIFQRAEHLGVKLDGDALKTILKYSEGNLLWTNQIIMQLSRSDYPQPISDKVVNDMLEDLSVFQIDDLIRAILAKDRNAIRVTQKLENENESLVYITTVLYREFATLDQILHINMPFAAACKTLRVWKNKQSQYQMAIKHYSPEQIGTAIQQLALLDRINKGLDKGDGWLLVTEIVSALILAER